jgi:hypothetical protein
MRWASILSASNSASSCAKADTTDDGMGRIAFPLLALFAEMERGP